MLNSVQAVLAFTGLVHTVTQVFAGSTAPHPPLSTSSMESSETAVQVRYLNPFPGVCMVEGESGNAFPVHQEPDPIPSVAGEVSTHRTVNSRLLMTWLNEFPFARNLTSSVFAVVPGTRSISTFVGICALAGPNEKRANAKAPIERRSLRSGVHDMGSGLGLG